MCVYRTTTSNKAVHAKCVTREKEMILMECIINRIRKNQIKMQEHGIIPQHLLYFVHTISNKDHTMLKKIKAHDKT